MKKHCSSCGAPICFAEHAVSGRRMVLNADPDPGGNILVRVLDGPRRVATVLPPARAAAEQTTGTTLFTSHFATCPNAEAHRRRRSRPRRGYSGSQQ